ncbi:hypothetical protein Vafri_7430, partial [Volvox africanus]
EAVPTEVVGAVATPVCVATVELPVNRSRFATARSASSARAAGSMPAAAASRAGVTPDPGPGPAARNCTCPLLQPLPSRCGLSVPVHIHSPMSKVAPSRPFGVELVPRLGSPFDCWIAKTARESGSLS